MLYICNLHEDMELQMLDYKGNEPVSVLEILSFTLKGASLGNNDFQKLYLTS